MMKRHDKTRSKQTWAWPPPSSPLMWPLTSPPQPPSKPATFNSTISQPHRFSPSKHSSRLRTCFFKPIFQC
ncbi:unnamed protein product [Allacma fusca]|uniref:Uncharacterized protein n=1 Tax=Allacma fusca TaxID=39272 RepID=A0A8J2P3Y9_9HEXA|nr:unnamed protein product [Allacma fusca]